MVLARISTLLISMAAIGLGGLAGCGSSLFSDSKLEFGGTCNVTKDQMASFMAPAKTFPLRVIQDSEFTKQEARAIADAVAEWNAVGRQVAGHDFFELVSGGIPDNVRNVDPRDCGESYSDDRSFYAVKITDMNRWKSLGFTTSIPGATVRCSSDYDLSHQIVLLNPGTSEKPLIDSVQFGSVVVHELGHALGLDHSCINEKGRPQYRSCRNLPADHPYRSAIMFPNLSVQVYSSALSTNVPEVKEIPVQNDVTRAQCLYSPKTED